MTVQATYVTLILQNGIYKLFSKYQQIDKILGIPGSSLPLQPIFFLIPNKIYE